ncbi:MAG: hypothetical protein LBU85_02005 [Treponema sp.]|jgi:hypothetical protein|nr:hypothetical protein [Treponema sp.]
MKKFVGFCFILVCFAALGFSQASTKVYRCIGFINQNNIDSAETIVRVVAQHGDPTVYTIYTNDSNSMVITLRNGRSTPTQATWEASVSASTGARLTGLTATTTNKYTGNILTNTVNLYQGGTRILTLILEG